MTWHLYVVRTVNGSLYAGIATNVSRRYQEHVTGGRKAAKFLRANPPAELVFKRLPKRNKELIVHIGRLHFNRESGVIRR